MSDSFVTPWTVAYQGPLHGMMFFPDDVQQELKSGYRLLEKRQQHIYFILIEQFFIMILL